MEGQVQLKGTHEELMKLEVLHHSLVKRLDKGMQRTMERMRSS